MLSQVRHVLLLKACFSNRDIIHISHHCLSGPHWFCLQKHSQTLMTDDTSLPFFFYFCPPAVKIKIFTTAVWKKIDVCIDNCGINCEADSCSNKLQFKHNTSLTLFKIALFLILSISSSLPFYGRFWLFFTYKRNLSGFICHL